MVAKFLIPIFSWLLVAPLSAFAEERGAIPIGTEDYPPYEMREPVDGLRGFDFELAVEIFTRMGFQPDIQFYPWTRALNRARNGDDVGILTCAYRDERAEFIHYSDPISSFTNGIFVRKGYLEVGPTKLSEFSDKTVGTVRDYASSGQLRDVGADVIEAPSTDAAILMLLRKRFDYLYLSRQTTDFLIKQAGLSESFDFYPLFEEDFYFCFSQAFEGVEKLVPEFNRTLAELRTNGVYDAIHSKYR